MTRLLGCGTRRCVVVWALAVILYAAGAHAQLVDWPVESAPRPLAPKVLTLPP